MWIVWILFKIRWDKFWRSSMNQFLVILCPISRIVLAFVHNVSTFLLNLERTRPSRFRLKINSYSWIALILVFGFCFLYFFTDHLNLAKSECFQCAIFCFCVQFDVENNLIYNKRLRQAREVIAMQWKGAWRIWHWPQEGPTVTELLAPPAGEHEVLQQIFFTMF